MYSRKEGKEMLTSSTHKAMNIMNTYIHQQQTAQIMSCTPASSVVVEKQVAFSSTNSKDVRALGPSTHTKVFSNKV